MFTAYIGVQKGCEAVITRNTRHFERIPGVKVETY